jgi:virulence-associated protein VapD
MSTNAVGTCQMLKKTTLFKKSIRAIRFFKVNLSFFKATLNALYDKFIIKLRIRKEENE